MSASPPEVLAGPSDLELELREFILAREKVPCPDCDLREDLTSYPDTQQGKPLKIRQGSHGTVKRCATCKGKGYVARGSAAS